MPGETPRVASMMSLTPAGSGVVVKARERVAAMVVLACGRSRGHRDQRGRLGQSGRVRNRRGSGVGQIAVQAREGLKPGHVPGLAERVGGYHLLAEGRPARPLC